MARTYSQRHKSSPKILISLTKPSELPLDEREVYQACLDQPQAVEQIAQTTNRSNDEVLRLLHFLNTRNLITKSLAFVGDKAELRYLAVAD